MTSIERFGIEGYEVPVTDFVQAIDVRQPGGILFISGLTGRSGEGIPEAAGEQAEVIFGVLGNILQSRGLGPESVVRVVQYFLDIDRDYAEVDAARTRFFGRNRPVSTSVQIGRLFDPRQRIEIEATAIIPSSDRTGP